jgi:uncharacterized protein (DUF2235 family)
MLTLIGISAKIRNAYSFISHNYNFTHDGDEIFLVGFSRGAFTVQCLASLIGQIGLLRKEGLQYLRGLFTLWANQEFRTLGSGDKKPLLQLLHNHVENIVRERGDAVKRNVKIKALAVWDTVSSLGLPTPQLSPRPLSFVGKIVPDIADNAFQALALDENRRHFKPRVWEARESETTNVKQCWFLGSHADVGGGNQDSGLASLSLLWMIAQLESKTSASFSEKALLDFLSPRSLEWEQSLNTTFRTYSEKLMVDSHTSTVGEYLGHSTLLFYREALQVALLNSNRQQGKRRRRAGIGGLLALNCAGNILSKINNQEVSTIKTPLQFLGSTSLVT